MKPDHAKHAPWLWAKWLTQAVRGGRWAELTGSEPRVLVALAIHQREDDMTVFAGVEELARLSGITPRAVEKALAGLAAKGIIRRRRRFNKSTVTTLLPFTNAGSGTSGDTPELACASFTNAGSARSRTGVHSNNPSEQSTRTIHHLGLDEDEKGIGVEEGAERVSQRDGLTEDQRVAGMLRMAGVEESLAKREFHGRVSPAKVYYAVRNVRRMNGTVRNPQGLVVSALRSTVNGVPCKVEVAEACRMINAGDVEAVFGHPIPRRSQATHNGWDLFIRPPGAEEPVKLASVGSLPVDEIVFSVESAYLPKDAPRRSAPEPLNAPRRYSS